MTSNMPFDKNRSTDVDSLLQENSDLRRQNQKLAKQVTQLIKTENRLFQFQSSLDRQLKTYQKLTDLGNALNQACDSDTVIDLAVEFALYELEFERCIFFSLNADTQQLYVRAFDGYYDETFAKVIQTLTIPWADLFNTPHPAPPLICSAHSSDSHLKSWCSVLGMDEYAAMVLHHETQSTLGLLVVGNTAEMWNYHTRVFANSSAITGLTNLSNQVSIAISNIRSYASQQKQTKELEKIVQARTQEIQQKNQFLKHTLRQLKNAQAQLIHNEKMLGLSQFVAGFAHEINNSINIIYANIDVASGYMYDLLAVIMSYQKQYPQDNPAIQQAVEDADLDFLQVDLPKLFRSTLTGAERIQNIMLSLKSFSRKNEAPRKRVNIHDGIDSALMLLEHRLHSDGNYPNIEIVKHYGKLPAVECYVAELNQVFMHLLNNSIDALQTQSDPAVVPCITIATESQNNRVIICITDNGPGIPQEIQAQIFEPFFTTKDIGQGPGLGLPNSYQIIHNQHGGRLEFQSQIGLGTTFEVTIPLELSP